MNFHGFTAPAAGPLRPNPVMTCVQVVNMENAIKLNIHVRVQGLSANGSGKKREIRTEVLEEATETQKTVSLVWSN